MYKPLFFIKDPDFSANKATPADVALFDIKDKKLLQFVHKSLGVKAIVFKKRELWEKENTVFHLDSVKNVGKIFEIELTSNGKPKQENATFTSYKNKFLPLLSKIIKGSNLDLVHFNDLNHKTF